ncbi:flagellar hook-basal body complex protein FliE [Sphingosinithalassobacter portus]|uniref:flagellar hook-basal body complex protein FliE n=1 Tax=Stakelama portus TaxID=2676234 RepID=UPI000D6E3899|nr:flagellar hook-basal body complex protein FliE [Sphingosinithalassobacter portus]
MTSFEPVAAISSVVDPVLMLRLDMPVPTTAIGGSQSFGSILMQGLQSVDQKVASADGLARAFALDPSMPVHQVTTALAEARISVELAMQVRSRLVEGYRELMNMQL